MKNKVEKNLLQLLRQKNKPLKGNSRSFSNRATKRNFHNNKQKFQIGSLSYQIPVKIFKKYLAIWQKNQ